MINILINKANVKNEYQLLFLGAWECRKCNKKKKSKSRTQSDLGSASFSDLAPIWLKNCGDVRYSMRTDKMRLETC